MKGIKTYYYMLMPGSTTITNENLQKSLWRRFSKKLGPGLINGNENNTKPYMRRSHLPFFGYSVTW